MNIPYTVVIDKNFLGKRHEEENKNILGANAEEAETQYWVDESTDAMKIEEMFFDRVSGDFTITLVNSRKEQLFLSVTIPIEEWIMKLGEIDITKPLVEFAKKYDQAASNIDEIKGTIRDLKE